MKDWIRTGAFAIVRRAQPLAARLTRPLTMGVRAVVLDSERRVCLVRHSYVAGWHLPGGGVEPGETLREALTRELREETGLAPEGEPELFGVYLNRRMANRDHVAVYVLRHDGRVGEPASRLEIRETGFFPVDALPDGATAPTRRRISEVIEAARPDSYW